ncbi:MAG: hypothetical protein EXR94_00685 [Gemmatimonadetes bacterium]|nr:hypothetical protein [Gemmatimonadota bacterium]
MRNGSRQGVLSVLALLGVVPAASPQSNGMSEAFVNTLRRDYLAARYRIEREPSRLALSEARRL